MHERAQTSYRRAYDWGKFRLGWRNYMSTNTGSLERVTVSGLWFAGSCGIYVDCGWQLCRWLYFETHFRAQVNAPWFWLASGMCWTLSSPGCARRLAAAAIPQKEAVRRRRCARLKRPEADWVKRRYWQQVCWFIFCQFGIIEDHDGDEKHIRLRTSCFKVRPSAGGSDACTDMKRSTHPLGLKPITRRSTYGANPWSVVAWEALP